MDEYDYYYHVSPIRSKWTEKTIEAAWDLVGNPLDPRKTRSQFHIASFASGFFLAEKLFMNFGSNPQTYYEASLYPICQTSMQKEFNSLQENETWELVPFPSKRKLV